MNDDEPGSIFDEDNYCHFCGSGKWKDDHAPSCIWRNAIDGVTDNAETFGPNPLRDPEVLRLLADRATTDTGP